MSRACHVSLNQCDNPNHQCPWANSRYFEHLCRKASLMPAHSSYKHNEAAWTKEHRRERIKHVKSLHSMSQHWHISAFEHVDFGANKRGICAATPTDLMHAFLEGVLKYLLWLWVDPLPADKKAQIDYLIRHIFGNLRNSEMKASTFLKSNFTHSFTNLTMLTADEWAGMTFTLLVILQSKDGQDILLSGLDPHWKHVCPKLIWNSI